VDRLTISPYQKKQPQSETQNRTKREDDTSIRGESVDFVHAAFHVKVRPLGQLGLNILPEGASE
jgi:hypothetical protein